MQSYCRWLFLAQHTFATSRLKTASNEWDVGLKHMFLIMDTLYGGRYGAVGSMVLRSAKGYEEQYPIDDLTFMQRI